MDKISDKVLLEELSRRLLKSEATIREQDKLLQQLTELNQKLENSERLKSHFLSNIKNEINNPLASILAICQQLVAKKEPLPPYFQKNIQFIFQETFSLEFQIRNIMAAAEVEAGEATPNLVLAHINPIIENVIHNFAYSAQKNQIRINCLIEDAIHFVTDIHFFNLMLSNLLSNAIKFNPTEGQVTIEITRQPHSLTMQVSDEGIGISKKDQHKIFDRFSQLEKGAIKAYAGHGLGLAVTRALADLLDGNITIKNQAIASTTFSIVLPEKQANDTLGGFSDEGSEIFFSADEQF